MKKGILLAVAMVLAFCIGIGSTLAYLFVESNSVVNTFAYGDINIELKEHKLENGVLDTSNEVTTNTTYKVIPGVTEPKDPFVRVLKGSEECYVYVAVQNSVKLNDGTVVATLNIDTTNWELVESNTATDRTLYRYKGTISGTAGIVDASADDVKLNSVFTEVTYDATKITKENISQVGNDQIIVWAYAHQSAGGVTQTIADDAAKAWYVGNLTVSN